MPELTMEETPPLLSLESAPSTVVAAEVTRAQLDRWAAEYGTQHRQLRRWIGKGREKSDPCPLDRPADMPAWWHRNMTWGVPPKITAAAERARASALAVVQVEPSAPVASGGLPASAIAPGVPMAPPMDISGLGMEEGEAVQMLRRLVRAAYDQVERAYKGEYGNVELLQKKFALAQEALRKAEKDDRADREKRGELIPRAHIQADLDAACEMLRQMRESMPRRVLEICPSLSAIQRDEVNRAITSVREHEERIFRRLDSLKTPADVADAIAA